MKFLAIAVLLGATAPLAAAPAAMTFKNVTTEFPADSAAYPDGPNVAVVNRNCLACHSAEMVLDQPGLPRATWTAEVNKMRATYKAPVSDADIAPIVDYLTATHGVPPK